MSLVTDEFPVVTRNEAGRAALQRWVHEFCDAYAAHAAVIRTLSQAEIVGEEVWGDGLKLLFRLAEAMTQGMTAATGAAEHAELTAVACLMMLERVTTCSASRSGCRGRRWRSGSRRSSSRRSTLHNCSGAAHHACWLGQLRRARSITRGPEPPDRHGCRSSVTAAALPGGARRGPGTPGRPARRRRPARRACPRARSARPQAQRLADEVLVRHRDEHRPPGGGQVRRPPGQLQRMPGVLAEVVRRVDEDPVRAHPGRHRPLGLPRSATRSPRRPRRGGRSGAAGAAAPARRRARRPGRGRARPPRAARPGSAPPQASLSRSAPAAATAAADRARQVSTLIATPGYRSRTAATTGPPGGSPPPR